MKPQQRHLWRFVLFAFFLNALLPFFAIYNTTGLTANSVKSAFGDRILICTGDGFRWIDRKDVSKQVPHKPGTHAECALCYFASHGLKNIALLAGVLLAYALRISIAQAIVAALVISRTYRLHLRHSRAPPVFSL